MFVIFICIRVWHHISWLAISLFFVPYVYDKAEKESFFSVIESLTGEIL